MVSDLLGTVTDQNNTRPFCIELHDFFKAFSLKTNIPNGKYFIKKQKFRIYVAGKVRTKGELGAKRSRMNGKLWADLTPEEHQQFPGDWEAQVGQGPITLHSDEHLATSDQGVVMLRRLLQRQLDAVASGGDPAGVGFDPAAPPVVFEAGNYILDRNDERAVQLLSA